MKLWLLFNKEILDISQPIMFKSHKDDKIYEIPSLAWLLMTQEDK